MKIRHKRLRAVQADLEILHEAADRVEGSGHAPTQYRQDIARLEIREGELLRRIRDGSDKENAAADHQRSKTHCPSGHPYAADNLIVDKRGYRKCRACKRHHDIVRWNRISKESTDGL